MEQSRAPAFTSHVLSDGVIPVGAAAGLFVPAWLSNQPSYMLQDAWIVVNGMVLTLGITQGTKRIVARERPAFHYGREGETEYDRSPGQANQSFVSGDTSSAFSVAASASTLAF